MSACSFRSSPAAAAGSTSTGSWHNTASRAPNRPCCCRLTTTDTRCPAGTAREGQCTVRRGSARPSAAAAISRPAGTCSCCRGWGLLAAQTKTDSTASWLRACRWGGGMPCNWLGALQLVGGRLARTGHPGVLAGGVQRNAACCLPRHGVQQPPSQSPHLCSQPWYRQHNAGSALA